METLSTSWSSTASATSTTSSWPWISEHFKGECLGWIDEQLEQAWCEISRIGPRHEDVTWGHLEPYNIYIILHYIDMIV